MPRPLSDSARIEMIRAANHILATEGLAGCTVDEVARRSGVAKTTIYRHFGGIDALVLAAVDSQVKQDEAPDTGSLRSDLQVILERNLKMADVPVRRELFAWMISRSLVDADFAERFRTVRFQSTGPTTIALQRAIARGEIAPTTDIAAAIHLIQGPLLSQRIVAREPVSNEALNTLIDQLVAALCSSS